MRAIVEASLFASSAADEMALVALLRFAFEGRHLVQTDPLTAPEVEEWLARQSLRLREQCELALAAGLERDTREPSLLTVRVGAVERPVWSNPCPILPLSMAVELLNRPCRILVESRRSDGDFLLTVADVHYRQRLEQALANGWAVVEHGGGIQEVHHRVRSLAREPLECLRTWVLFDSDALAPGWPSQQSRSLQRDCQRWSIPHHSLQRRTAENYLPVPALEHWSERNPGEKRRYRKAIRAFSRMTAGQRHHYNVRRGFAGDESHQDQAVANDLYATLPPDGRQALLHGFSDAVTSLFGDHHVRAQTHWFALDGQTPETLPMIDELLALL